MAPSEGPPNTGRAVKINPLPVSVMPNTASSWVRRSAFMQQLLRLSLHLITAHSEASIQVDEHRDEQHHDHQTRNEARRTVRPQALQQNADGM